MNPFQPHRCYVFKYQSSDGSKMPLNQGGSDSKNSDEAGLLKEVAGGDLKAFSQLYDRFCGLLYSVAFSLLSDASDSEDLLQDVFVKIWKCAHQYSSREGSETAWLIVMTRNAALTRLRSKRRRDAALERAAMDPSQARIDSIAAFDNIISFESSLAVRKALTELTEDQREVLELAFLKGLTHEEIALLLEQPLGTVKSRLRRGMKALKSKLDVTNRSP